MVTTTFGAGAFIYRAANLVARHLFKRSPRPTRRPTPPTLTEPRQPRNEYVPRPINIDYSLRRRANRARALHRTKSRTGGPNVKQALRAERLRRQNTVDLLIFRHHDVWKHRGSDDPEQDIVWKAFESLQFDRIKREAMAEQEEISDRVKANAGRRKKEMVHRNALAAKLLRMKAIVEQEKVEQAKKKAECEESEKRQKEAQEFRNKIERQLRERAEQNARERLEHEARVKAQQEAKERREQQLRERAEQEAKLNAERMRQAEELRRKNEEFERRRREQWEQQQREQQARERAAREELDRLRATMNNYRSSTKEKAVFDLYDRKWDALKSGFDINGAPIPLLTFSDIPWPILLNAVSRPDDITTQRLKDFMFHPIRKDTGVKSQRLIIKQEMVRWHPDKFNMTVLAKVKPEDKQAVAAGAGEVARLFTAIMNDL